MIRLENLTKTFKGQKDPAVEDLTMEIPEGEICVLVGPSGCGKTTTMRMINRLIEPDSGKIFLEGEDVTSVDSDQLRRRIGYVIQQIGLFPHMTIEDNIATVPRLLGWDKKKTSDRTDELLEMVGMDPSDYRRRYPKELSGGQRQRIGVARAMAADPSVMLITSLSEPSTPSPDRASRTNFSVSRRTSRRRSCSSPMISKRRSRWGTGSRS